MPNFKKLFLILIAFCFFNISVFSAEVVSEKIDALELSEEEWESANNLSNFSAKANLNFSFESGVSIANVAASLLFDKNAVSARATLRLPITIDTVIKSQLGNPVSGVYNAYLDWNVIDDDKVAVDKIYYTPRNSEKYTDISTDYDISEFISGILEGFLFSENQNSKFNDYNEYIFDEGKYKGSFFYSLIDENDKPSKIDVVKTFSIRDDTKVLNQIDLNIEIVDFQNPFFFDSKPSNAYIKITSYIYDQGTTVVKAPSIEKESE